MKRYALLIIGIILFVTFRNYWLSWKLSNQVVVLRGQVDSLKNVTYFYEANQVSFEKNIKEATKIACDSMNLRIKGRDSTIFSHDQQVRWLQWHVERLNKLNNQ